MRGGKTHKVLFGSNHPFWPPGECIAGIDDLGLNDSANPCFSLRMPTAFSRSVEIRFVLCNLRCPLWVKSRHMRCNKPCPLYTRKRPRKRNSAKGHVRFTPNSGHVRRN
jgi:hypothetical protein